MDLILGVALLLMLIAVSVVISLSEVSFVAARESRLQARVDAGDPRAVRFMSLRRQSGRVITAFQICLNGVGVLGGVVGDGMLAPVLARWLTAVTSPVWAAGTASVIAFCLVTSLFVLFADLIPKRVAMQAPERVALMVVWFPSLAVRVFRPLVWLFTSLSDAVLRALRLQASSPAEVVTPEDLRATIAAGAASGALGPQEHQLIENVLLLEGRSVTSVMTPREDIVFLDLRESDDVLREKVRNRPFSRYPLCDGGMDAVVGVVRAEDVLAGTVERGSAPLDLRRARREVPSVPETLNVWEVLAQFQAQGAGFAVVVSEYGVVVGVVSFKDVLGALVDGLASPFEEQPIVQRDERSWLVDGIAPMTDVVRVLGIEDLVPSTLYETAGGFVMHRLRRVARKADRVDAAGFVFEVVDADRLRINQLLVTRRDVTADGSAPVSTGADPNPTTHRG